MQLASLQLAANTAVDTVNARGPLINACLHDVPACVQEIALHDVHHGVLVASVMTQVQTTYKLHALETDFPMGDGPEEHEDLIEEFIDVVESIVDITSSQDVVNKVFD